MSECLSGQQESERDRRTVCLIQLAQNVAIARRIDNDQDIAKVLGGGADHARSADVDLLDELLEGDARARRGLFERIQVHDHDVDEADPVRLERGEVVVPIPARKDAAVDTGVERLHASVQHLRKAGDRRDARHGEAGVRQSAGRPAGRDELEAARGERAGEVDEAVLLRDAQ